MSASLRSVAAGGTDVAHTVAEAAYIEFAAYYPEKMAWFFEKGYVPHSYQAAFHSATTAAPDLEGIILGSGARLTRWRHLVAGRRGGKTLSAAWEVVFYCLHPEVFHMDAHSAESSRPLWVWVLTKDHEVGRPARMAMREVMNLAGLVDGRDYKWNKTEKTIEFSNGSFLQFRTADDPQSLRGAGLDILWIDEAAFIRTEEAYNVSRPTLSDHLGMVITTSTPKGKNWFYEHFFRGKPLKNPNQFRVEYTSIDNPYFSAQEWQDALEEMHPSLFRQEYMASFDSMDGLTLSGDWLQYWTVGKPDRLIDIQLPRDPAGTVRLKKYIGVDPSTGESDDEFAICCIGVTPEMDQAFLLDIWKGKILFPEQVDMIQTWFGKYRPDYIGIEANAYQRVLIQQTARIEGMPPIVPVMSRGSKNERIVGMAPMFKHGRIRIHQSHHAFIDQWVSFDGARKDNKDDLLDAVEIALGGAGVILPRSDWGTPTTDAAPKTIHDEARAQIAGMKDAALSWDPELGIEG